MALATFVIDPAAAIPLTGDEIIAKINTDTVNPITRASSVSAAARPLVADEVSDVELTATAAKDNLSAMADIDRGFVRTQPTSGEFPIINVQRDATGQLEVEYDDVAIV
ncbi:hypothetical protein LCGC14_2471180 [marine sediment metagenome]|uniref:Uncharacterized protein n=1 Tax=marine sediment metagenome TaxID=412755 RepID=A0A0F9BY52_9ZZZZ